MFTPLLVVLADTPVDHTGLGIQNNQQIALYIGVLLPVVVALITRKLGDSSRYKAMALLALNLLNGFLTELLGQGDFHFWSAVNGVILSFVTGVVALYGFLKPTGASDALLNMGRKDRP